MSLFDNNKNIPRCDLHFSFRSKSMIYFGAWCKWCHIEFTIDSIYLVLSWLVGITTSTWYNRRLSIRKYVSKASMPSELHFMSHCWVRLSFQNDIGLVIARHTDQVWLWVSWLHKHFKKSGELSGMQDTMFSFTVKQVKSQRCVPEIRIYKTVKKNGRCTVALLRIIYM